MKKKTIFSVLLWSQIAIVVLILLGSSLGKFVKDEAQIENAVNWGFPYYVMYSIALFELIIVFLLFKNVKIGLFMITVLMVGAIITHLWNGETQFIIINLIILLFVLGIYFMNKKIQKMGLSG